MPTLPPSSDITASTTTEGGAKTWLAALRTFVATLLGADGNQSTALAALGVPMNASTTKSGAYTVVASDRGKVIRCTGTWTLALTAAATLGDGFCVEVVNEGAGTITIDPNLSELIGGATTKTLSSGSSAIVYCDGTKFALLGGGVTATDISAALGFTPANAATAALAANAAPMTSFVNFSFVDGSGGGYDQYVFTRASGGTLTVNGAYHTGQGSG